MQTRALTQAWRYARLTLLALQIRALEATAQGQQEVLSLLAWSSQDHEQWVRINMRHQATKLEIIQRKAEWRRIKYCRGIQALVV